MFMSPSELKAIDDWAWKCRVRSKSEAVRRLCQIGLVVDEHIEDIAETIGRVREEYNTNVLAAAEELNNDGDNNYVEQTLNLSIETMENLSTLLHQFNRILAPVRAMKAEGTFRSAQIGMLIAQSDSLVQLIQEKIDRYESRKQHGFSDGKK